MIFFLLNNISVEKYDRQRRVLLQVGDFIMSCPVLQPGFVLLMKLRTLAGLYSSAETYADRELKELKPNSYSSAGTKAP